MLKFYATPLADELKEMGFYFDDIDEFNDGIEKIEAIVDDPEIEIEIIDWDPDIDPVDPTNVDLNSDNIGDWIARFERISEMDTYDKRAFKYLLGDLGYNVEDALDKVDRVCLFEGSLAEYAEQFHSDIYGELPSYLEGYVDWQALGETMEVNGAIHELDNGWIVINHEHL